MKKLFLLVATLCLFQHGNAVIWTSGQVVRLQQLQNSFIFWASEFIPFDQVYQLMDNNNIPNSGDGLCQGASIAMMSNLFDPSRSLDQVLQGLTINAATPGTNSRNIIETIQFDCDSIYQAETDGDDYLAAMQNYYSTYFNLNMTPNVVWDLDSEHQSLINSYAGGGINDPALYNAITGNVRQTIDILRDFFAANPVAAANIDLGLYQGRGSNLSTAASAHTTTVFRGTGGHIIFFDPNVGIGIFPDFSHFESFLNAYSLTELETSSGSGIDAQYQLIFMVETFTASNQPSNQGCAMVCAATSSSRSSNAYSGLGSQNLTLGPAAQNFINTYLDFCSRKLVFKNVNYEDLSIQILLKHTTDVYFPNFAAGDELIFDYDESTKTYYYNGYEVQSIDLDEGRHPIGAMDQHDNMDFSWTGNSTITYKPRNLFNAEVLIDNYKNPAHIQYREVIDADGINHGSANAIIASYGLGEREYIEVKKWGTKKIDLSKLEKVRFSNMTYDDIGQKRIRLGNNTWDLWPNLHQGTTIDFDYHGNGAVKHNGNILQQIDMYWTAPTTYYSGDELDFSWHNAHQINYRPYWSQSWNNIPTVTLVDFNNGSYASYVDADGIQGYSAQMYMKVYVSIDQKVLHIELHGRASNPTERHVFSSTVAPIEESIGLTLMPNPSHSTLHVSIDGMDTGEDYLIYDALGRLVKQQAMDKGNVFTQIDVSSLENGVYYITLSNLEGAKIQEKFIVAH